MGSSDPMVLCRDSMALRIRRQLRQGLAIRATRALESRNGKRTRREVRDPPMIRLAKWIAGPTANAEAIGIAIAVFPMVVLGLWISSMEPWTVWGTIMSAYYFTVPLILLQSSSRSRFTARKPAVKRAEAVGWLVLFAFWVPSLIQESFRADIIHAGTALLGALFLSAVVDAFIIRIIRCPACGEVERVRVLSQRQAICSRCGRIL